MHFETITALSLPGLPGHGGTARAPISAWETFPSRVVVLLSGMALSWLELNVKPVNVCQILADDTLNYVLQPTMRSMQALSTVIQKASVNNFSGSAVLNLLQSQVMKLSCDYYFLYMFKKLLFSYMNQFLKYLILSAMASVVSRQRLWLEIMLLGCCWKKWHNVQAVLTWAY